MKLKNFFSLQWWREALEETGLPLAFLKVRTGAALEWWEWGKIIFLPLAAVIAAWLIGLPVPAWLMGMAIHFFCDFSFQSGKIADGKARRDIPLLCLHSLTSGGLKGAAVGFMAGGPIGCLAGFASGFATHFLVDFTRKFGVKNWKVGIGLDQLCHVIEIFIIMALVKAI